MSTPNPQDAVMRQYQNRVRHCRLRAIVATQKELAERTGIDVSTLSLIENNKRFLSAPYALLIAEALGCSIEDLYEKASPQDVNPEDHDEK